MYISFITDRGKDPSGRAKWGYYVIYENIRYDVTDQIEDYFPTTPNWVFLYSVNKLTEFIIQQSNYINLYTINFEEERSSDEAEQVQEIKDMTAIDFSNEKGVV